MTFFLLLKMSQREGVKDLVTCQKGRPNVNFKIESWKTKKETLPTLPCKKLAKNSSHKSVIRNSFLAVINAESAFVIAQDNCPVSP